MLDKDMELIELLERKVCSDDFIEVSYNIVEEFKKKENPFEFVEQILGIMERNPDAYFGRPGPLVHFIETFYGKGYEKELLESVKRRPTLHTVWLVKRIINDSKLIDKSIYLSALNEVLEDNTIDEKIKNEISRYQKR